MCEGKKRLTRLTVVVGALASTAMLGVAPAFAGSIHADLRAVLADTRADQPVSALVYLNDRVNLPALEAGFRNQRAPLQVRHETVVRALQKKAQVNQVAILNYLAARERAGTVISFTRLWIVNAVVVEALPSEIRTLAARHDVETVYFNYVIESITPADEVPNGGGGSGPEPGVVAVRAPEVWALGITGTGTLTSTLDTGVDGNHPSLASRWRGLDPGYAGNPEWAWFDPLTNTTFPQGFGSHGTHTMGTVCGGLPGDEVGVAPGAEWIHAAVIRGSISQVVANAILAFQWLIDPDGDPSTNFDVADVCSNSWGLLSVHGFPPCDDTFWSFLDACEAAGIVMLFSAGNEGFSGLRRPADRATDDYRSTAVAAVDGNVPSWPIAGFSSRGPTFCTPDGSAAIKPEIAAPGVSVRSSIPGGGYAFFSGTSMASPHVNGVVCLMREANPNLGVDEIKQIIYDTAFDLGAPGNDNDYGWGMIDAFEAVQEALAHRVGACCLPNRTCVRTDEADCLDRCGTYRGDNTFCLVICIADIEIESTAAPSGGESAELEELQVFPCRSVCLGTPDEACCFVDGTCSDEDDCVCDEQGGTPQGPGTTCELTDCPPPGGGCCLEDGTCIIADQTTCEGQCGSYKGDNSNCNVICAVVPTEACCFGSTCSVATVCACQLQGGTARGSSTNCNTGACCFRDGACKKSNICKCKAAGGFFRGSGTSCSTVLCPAIVIEFEIE